MQTTPENEDESPNNLQEANNSSIVQNIIEYLAPLLDTKKALEIKQTQITMNHEYDMKRLEKRHDYLIKKQEAYRQNLILYGIFTIIGLCILLVFVFILAQIGLKDSIMPTLQTLVSVLAVGFGASQYSKKKK